MPPTLRQLLPRSALLAAVIALTGCAIAKPRTDDPWESFNRKTYAFNMAVDKVTLRPVAKTYRKVTSPPVREHINNFLSNIQLPVTVANDLLQARPKQALETSGRFLINLTLGFLGFFDPASQLGIPQDDNDFGVTLARWGVPDGPYLMLPFLGPTTPRDFWRIPVDGYFFDPLSIYARNHSYRYGQQYLPELAYLVTLRTRALDAESFLESAYDPYVFLRDAYRQRRLYKVYYGNPPAEIIERMQGLDENNFDPEKLLEQQHAWEKKHGMGAAGQQGGSTDTPAQPAPAARSSEN